MSSRPVSTVILGTGPAGLTAGYKLALAGDKPVLLERGKSAGGLMQSLKRNDFILDIGRKQLYSRIPEIHELWRDLLGDDYRPYQRRVGILYKGNILESSRRYRGRMLGMPLSLFAACGADFLWSAVRFAAQTPANNEEYWYRRRGRMLSRILTQGYEERFRGDLWKNMPVPATEVGGRAASLLAGLRSKFGPTSGPETSEPHWYHPARGTGQICERLEEETRRHGGEFMMETAVESLRLEGNRVVSIQATRQGRAIELRPQNVIASIPIEHLAKLVLPGRTTVAQAPVNRGRSTALVYLFLDEPPRFPHTFLEVSCPTMKTGRIANFAALGGDMVPVGTSCLCVEYFLDAGDPLLELSTDELADLAVEECTRAGVIDPARLTDKLALKFPGADAATDYRDWLTEERRELLIALERFENLFFVNRAGTDAASYAGIEAASAILTGSREKFDRVSDPKRTLRRAASAA